MIEEFLLEQKFGRRRPFKVPEGYFEKLEEHVIGKVNGLPIIKRHTVWHRVRPWTWAACAAAAITVSVFCFKNVKWGDGKPSDTALNMVAPSVSADYIIDEMSDYAMLDNDDYYSFIADE